MQASVKRTCGHLTNENLFGSSAERERRKGWLATQPCLACQRAATTATAQAETAELPALVGSERQVAWATTIRASQIKAVATFATEAAARIQDPAKQAVLESRVAQTQAALAAETSAKWWIDHRADSGQALVATLSTVEVTA